MAQQERSVSPVRRYCDCALCHLPELCRLFLALVDPVNQESDPYCYGKVGQEVILYVCEACMPLAHANHERSQTLIEAAKEAGKLPRSNDGKIINLQEYVKQRR